jgi:hypothetical protein
VLFSFVEELSDLSWLLGSEGILRSGSGGFELSGDDPGSGDSGAGSTNKSATIKVHRRGNKGENEI